eukprot:gene4814-5168_t
MSKQVLCRNYPGCKFGDRCMYSHQKQSVRPSTSVTPTIHRPPPVNRTQVVSQVEAPTSTKPPSAIALNTSVYVENGELPLYAQIAKLTVAEEEQPNELPPPPYFPDQYDPANICSFFLAGNCKFGFRCRNLHITQQEYDDSVTAYTQFTKPTPKECGICIEPAPTALYGLMSHCDCKFCLECIRGWRKEGLTVAKKSDQVRLCPLCRTESHFVVPSSDFLTGEAKQALLEAYKNSLSAKPCKYYNSGKECPFGTSCFYLHEEDGFKGTKRKFFKAEDEVMINAQVKLGDFLR